MFILPLRGPEIIQREAALTALNSGTAVSIVTSQDEFFASVGNARVRFLMAELPVIRPESPRIAELRVSFKDPSTPGGLRLRSRDANMILPEHGERIIGAGTMVFAGSVIIAGDGDAFKTTEDAVEIDPEVEVEPALECGLRVVQALVARLIGSDVPTLLALPPQEALVIRERGPGSQAVIRRENRGITALFSGGVAAQPVLADIVARKQAEVIEQLFELATIREEDEFLKAMYGVSPFLRTNERDQALFVDNVVKRFPDFGPRVRQAIANELKRFGLDERFMDDLAGFSSTLKAPQRMEAINGLAAGIGRMPDDSIEVELGVVAICKFLEETAADTAGVESRVAVHAVRKLSGFSSLLIVDRDDRRIKPVLAVARKLLVSDPDVYGLPVGMLLIAVGEKYPELISRFVREELSITENPKLRIIYLRILQQTETSADVRAGIFRERLDLFLTLGDSLEAKSLSGQFKGRSGESVDGILSAFDQYEEDRQCRLIELLDDVRSTAGAEDKAKISHFLAGIVLSRPEPLRRTVLRTETIYSEEPPECTLVFGQAIADRIEALLNDKTFMDRLSAKPGMYLPHIANAAKGLGDPAQRLSLIETAIGLAHSPLDNPDIMTVVSEDLVAGVLSAWKDDLSDEERERGLRIVGSLAVLPATTDGMIAALYAVLEQNMGPSKIRATIPALSRMAGREAGLPSDIVSPMMIVFTRWFHSLLPPPPGNAAPPAGDRIIAAAIDEQVNLELLDIVLSGIANLFNGDSLDLEAQKNLATLLVKAVSERRQPVGKGQEPKPDPAKESILAALKRIADARYTVTRLRQVIGQLT